MHPIDLASPTNTAAAAGVAAAGVAGGGGGQKDQRYQRKMSVDDVNVTQELRQ